MDKRKGMMVTTWRLAEEAEWPSCQPDVRPAGTAAPRSGGAAGPRGALDAGQSSSRSCGLLPPVDDPRLSQACPGPARCPGRCVCVGWRGGVARDPGVLLHGSVSHSPVPHPGSARVAARIADRDRIAELLRPGTPTPPPTPARAASQTPTTLGPLRRASDVGG